MKKTKQDPPKPQDVQEMLEEGEYNNLIFEKSPYLLQHAENPVNWYPWGPEAFTKAQTEDKPIFLSIGYSTCHWCHVMERESFEDPEVAELMNDVFVSIKVDREERPDIDNVYMLVCQMLTGSGGWPWSGQASSVGCQFRSTFSLISFAENAGISRRGGRGRSPRRVTQRGTSSVCAEMARTLSL